MAAPCALITSCSSLEPLELVKQILGDQDLTEAVPIVEDIKAYQWHIDTKYYTANIQLCTTSDRTIGDRDFADNVQAFIVHFDTTQESSFEGVQLWLPYVKELKPVVQLLVCNTCGEGDAISKHTAWTWCLENDFELVELYPLEDSESEEDDFMETTGVKRVVQALHAHTWPNLLMKEKPSFRSPYMQQMMANEAASNAASNQMPLPETTPSNQTAESTAESETSNQNQREPDNGRSQDDGSASAATANQDAGTDNALPTGAQNDSTSQSTLSELGAGCLECGMDPVGAMKAAKQLDNVAKKQEGVPRTGEHRPASSTLDGVLSSDDLELFTALGSDNPNEESFEQLFQRLRFMKEKAQGLPQEQRKVLAEQVAVQFWRAVGGDDDEIDGLSSDDD